MFKKILLMLLMVAPLSLLAQKVAHYNSQDIVTNYSEFKKVQTELEAIKITNKLSVKSNKSACNLSSTR